MNIVLWVLQVLLALIFVAAGLTKALLPIPDLVTKLGDWVNDYPPMAVRLIGILEVLAGVALIVPWALDIAPVLTPLAAAGLVVVMVGAAITHGRYKETSHVINTIALGVAALIVAIGRF